MTATWPVKVRGCGKMFVKGEVSKTLDTEHQMPQLLLFLSLHVVCFQMAYLARIIPNQDPVFRESSSVSNAWS